MFDPYAQFQTAVLTNGLTVHVLHWPERPGMRFNFGIHSGARHDLSGKEGTAHFMEHLVSNNALVPHEELKEFFETNSGHHPHLGTTSFHSTWYGFHSSVDPDLLSTSLRYFGHMLLHSTLENFVERERGVIIGEFNRAFPAAYQYELIRRVHLSVFPNTFLSRMSRPLGTLKSIKELAQADLQQFYDVHYTPANMSVIGVGEFTLEQTLAFLEASPFGIAKPGIRSEAIEPITESPFPTETLELFEEGKYVQGKTVAQYDSFAQLPGIFTSAEMRVFAHMLNKILFKEIREERSWAYSIGCGGAHFPDFRFLHLVSDGVRLDAIEEIEEVVRVCIESLAESESLFKTAKAAVIAQKRFGDPHVTSVANSALQDLFFHGRVISLAEEIQEAEKVSMDRIRQIVTYLDPERRRTCIRHP